jgi:hypothetical protein
MARGHAGTGDGSLRGHGGGRGAARCTAMMHIVIGEARDGTPVAWREHATDARCDVTRDERE